MPLAVGSLPLDLMRLADAWLVVPAGSEGYRPRDPGSGLAAPRHDMRARKTMTDRPSRAGARSGAVPDGAVARGGAGPFRGRARFRAASPSSERSLAEALGLALAENVVAPVDVPPFDRANVDGFAVRSADIDKAARRQRRPA